MHPPVLYRSFEHQLPLCLARHSPGFLVLVLGVTSGDLSFGFCFAFAFGISCRPSAFDGSVDSGQVAGEFDPVVPFSVGFAPLAVSFFAVWTFD